jgi:hypothetical protein
MGEAGSQGRKPVMDGDQAHVAIEQLLIECHFRVVVRLEPDPVVSNCPQQRRQCR